MDGSSIVFCMREREREREGLTSLIMWPNHSSIFEETLKIWEVLLVVLTSQTTQLVHI
jgi:hypothetical protein